MALDNAYRQKIIRDLGPTGIELLRQGRLDDDVLEQYAQAKGITPDDFSGVTASVDTTEPVPEARPASDAGFFSQRGNELSTQLDQARTLGSSALDAVQSFAQRRLSSDILNAQDQAAVAQERRPGWAQDNLAGDILYGNPFSDLTQMADVAISRMARGQWDSDFSDQAITDEARALRDQSLANRQAAEAGVDTIGTARGFAEAIVDVAGSPTSALSVFGGPFGGLPVAEVYQDTFAEARLAGLSPEDARVQALSQAAPEAIGFIPAGRFIPGMGAVKRALSDEIASTATRTSTRLAANVLGEGAEEGVTQLLQTAANKAVATTSDDESARAYAESQLPQNAADLFDQVWRATKAGMVGGGGIGSVISAREVAVQNANAYMDTLTGGLEASRELADKARSSEVNFPQIDEQLKADEMEAGFRTIERERAAEALREQARSVSRQDISNPIAAALADARVAVTPVTPQEVAAERLAAVTPSRTAQEAPQEAPAPAAPVVAPKPRKPYRMQEPGEEVPATESEINASYRELFPEASDEEIVRMVAEEKSGQKTQLARKPADDGTFENTAEQVVRSIAERVRVGNDRVANSLGKLVAKKKLVVVDNEEQIPNFDRSLTGAAGLYDSKSGKLYAVANRLDPNNLVGEMLNVAAHETKHQADVSGNADLSRGSLRPLIGDKANKTLVETIDRQAANGNEFAQSVIDSMPAGMDEATRTLELPAYALNKALETEGKGIPAVARGLISAIRTNAKSKLGIDEINNKDLGYLAKKLVERNALSDGATTGTGEVPAQQAMIYGAGSTQFRDALRRGITFQAKDGTTKYVLSDKDSSIKPQATQKLENTRPGEGVRLEEVLRHSTLYDQYPQLRDMLIRAEPLAEEGYGEYRWGSREVAPHIRVSPDLLSGKEIMTPAGDVVNLRTAILHEVQHAIQDIEGQSGRFAAPRTLTTEDKEIVVAKQRAQRALDSADRKILTDLDALARSNEVSPQQRRILLSTINDNNRTPSERITEAASYLDDSEIFVPDDLQSSLDNRESLRKAYNETVPGFNAVSLKNYEQYRRNTTEQDAFFTQNNADVAQEDLPINPEETYDRAIDVPGQLAMMRLPQVKNSIIKATRDARQIGTEGHDSTFWNAVFGAIDYTGGLGKNIRDKIDTAVGSAAHVSEMARHNMKNLELGIEALAKRWVSEGKAKSVDDGVKQVNAMLSRRIAALQTINSVNRRENAIVSLTEQYPELRPFARSMADIRELTEALVAQHREATPNPTPNDIKFQQDLLDNVLSYTTRMYAALQGPSGRKHSNKMLADAKTAVEKMAEGKKLTPAEKEAHDVVSTAVQYLIDNELAVPDKDTLDTLKDSRLNSLYDTWMPESAANVRAIAEAEGIGQGMTQKEAAAYATQTIRERLDARRDSIPAKDLQKKAEAAVREILGLQGAKGPIASKYTGLDVDRGIFKKRTHIPQEIRNLLGEIKDPITMLGVTQAKQGELLSRNKLLMQLKDAGLIVTQDKANTTDYAAFTERLTGDNAGPLKDQYTTPRVAAAINSSVELYSQVTDAMTNAWLDTDGTLQAGARNLLAGVKWGAGKAKVLALIAELFGVTANALGSPVMLAANGVIDPRAAARGAKAGINSIADVLFDGRGDVSSLLARGIKYQVVDSARVQELRRSSQKYIKSKLRDDSKAVGAIRKNFNTGWATAIEMFAMSDAWVKLAAFEDRSNYLREFYKAEGVTKSPGEIDEEAGNDIRNSNITYGKTPPILRSGESVGLTTFLPYFYNVPRSLAHSMYLGAQDVIRGKKAETPEGRNLAIAAGVKRMAGTGAAMVAIPKLTMLTAEWISKMVMPGDDEEEKEKKLEALKKTLPREGRFGDPIYMGQDDKDRPVFFRASRLDPYGPVTDLIRIATDDSIGPEEAADQMTESITSLVFQNRLTKTLVETVSGQTPTNSDSRLERTFPKITSAVKDVLNPAIGFKLSKASLRVLDSISPGIVDAIDPANTGAQEGGTEMSELLSKTVVGIGGRLDKGDPAARARQLGFEIGDRRKKAREELFDAVANRASPEALEKIIRQASVDIYDDMSQLSDVYEGATDGMGMSPRRVMTILKEEGKLNANEIANIRRGIPKTYETEDLALELGRILSKKSIEQRTKKRERYETDEEVEEFTEQTRDLIKRLKSRGIKESK